MYQPYGDITARLGMPLWWDESGVPRYEPFEPRLCADIYNTFAALVAIRCQGCGAIFPVASSWSLALDNAVWDENGQNPKPKAGFPKLSDPGFCGYGDAPFHPLNGQCSGTTMTTDVVRILEFWHDDKRCPEYEVYVGEDEVLGNDAALRSGESK